MDNGVLMPLELFFVELVQLGKPALIELEIYARKPPDVFSVRRNTAGMPMLLVMQRDDHPNSITEVHQRFSKG
jgi:hypothetical protein